MAPAPNEATPVHEAIGHQVRAARERAGHTQDDVATDMRAWGLRWDRTIVAKVERGTRPLLINEILLLCVVLDIGLPALLPDSGKVALTDTTNVKISALQRVLTDAHPAPVTAREMTVPALDPTALATATLQTLEAIQRIRPTLDQVWGSTVPTEDLTAAISEASADATRKAAARLQIEPLVVAVAARRLWGHSLATERDQHLDHGHADSPSAATRASRGHTTRKLLADLRDLLAATGVSG